MDKRDLNQIVMQGTCSSILKLQYGGMIPVGSQKACGARATVWFRSACALDPLCMPGKRYWSFAGDLTLAQGLVDIKNSCEHAAINLEPGRMGKAKWVHPCRCMLCVMHSWT